MAKNGTVGEPIPTGRIGDFGAATTDAAAMNSAEQLAVIRDELKQLSHTVAQLAEMTTRYAQQRVQNAAQTAVDRYPVGSILAAALIGYWFAGRRR